MGLNLQEEASIVYSMDPWYNPQVELQAFGRVHRLGQTQQVYVRRFIAVGTVEKRVQDVQTRKLQISNAALSSGYGAAGAKLNYEDMKHLMFGGDAPKKKKAAGPKPKDAKAEPKAEGWGK